MLLDEINEKIKDIEDDSRYKTTPASIQINAPLALIQTDLWVKLHILKWVKDKLEDETQTKWVSVKDRLPEEYSCCYLRWTYRNGNTGRAIGFFYGDEWEIDWSDDHPQSEDISHWLEEG